MSGFVKTERHGRVALLTLDHPEALNAIGSRADCDDFVAALEVVNADRGISAMVLTGAGRAFSSGGNLKGMRHRNGVGPLDQPDSTRENYRRGIQRVTRAFMDLDVPAIAAINGHAIGLGLDLACLCDIRIVADSARMAASFIKVGIVPGDGGAWSLARVVGYSKAAELFFTGDSFDAEAALAMGLVSRVVPLDALLPEAMELAGRIAANPARALRMTKRLLREAQHSRMGDVLELSAAYQAIAHETADHREAVDAILEKRPPTFTGG